MSKSMEHHRKRDPYEFWHSIGSPKYVVAPMVDNSDLAYRMMTRKYGAHLTYTQMFNSNIFSQSKEMRKNLFQTCEGDRPLFVQIAGHDPATMLKAAKYVENHGDAVDINLGCPQGIAKRGKYGAFLMEELDLLFDIVSLLVQNLSIPVTVKTRIYKDDFPATIRLLETLISAGASVITLHGRTREEKGQLVDKADWQMIKRVKEYFSQRAIPIPVIANGGIENLDDINRCIEYTKVDAVMSSEAILENPALFTNNICPITNRTMDFIELTEEYLDYCEKYPGFKIIRSHALKMLYRYIRDDKLLLQECSKAQSIDDFRNLCHTCRELVERRKIENPDYIYISWYLRHRHPAAVAAATSSTTVSHDNSENTNANTVNRAYQDPDTLLNLKHSLTRGDGADDTWNDCDDNGNNCGIFAGLSMFESQE